MAICRYDLLVNLTANEARVLGCLIEKDITTPDNYPLSLNSLVNACNQKSNRDPAMTLDESTVLTALDGLNQLNLAGTASGADSRVTKYEHRVYDTLKLGRREIAIMCELLIRGPQTSGELRGRAERMHKFEDISDVQSTLQRLMQWDPPLVAMLPRQPGTKESRYAHLMSGEVESAPLPVPSHRTAPLEDHDRVARLEQQVTEMRTELDEVKRQLDEMKKVFE